MLISLVVATVDRTEELVRFLQALNGQTYRQFELIVVDQNPDNSLAAVLSQYADLFPIRHLRSERGVSRARNRGIAAARGDVIGFPDDDCWYPQDLLEEVSETLETHHAWDGLTGRCLVKPFGTHAGLARFAPTAGLLTPVGIWTRSCAATLFVRRTVIDGIGPFDDSLGPGSGTAWEAAEDMDYVLRAVENGFHIYYEPDLVVFHPPPPSLRDERSLVRAFTYGMGAGRVLRIHNQPFWFVCLFWLRAAARGVVSLLKMDTRAGMFYLKSLQGRMLGWLSKEAKVE